MSATLEIAKVSSLFSDSIDGFIFTEHFPNSVNVVECHIGIKESPFMDRLEAKYMNPAKCYLFAYMINIHIQLKTLDVHNN